MQKEPLVDIRDAIHKTAQEFGYYRDIKFPLATIIDAGKPEVAPTEEQVEKYWDLKYPIPWRHFSLMGLDGYDGADVLARKAIMEARLGFLSGNPCSTTQEPPSIPAPKNAEDTEFVQELKTLYLGMPARGLVGGHFVTHLQLSPATTIRIALGYGTHSKDDSESLFNYLGGAIRERTQYFQSTGQLL